MGLDFSHCDASWGYGSFLNFRNKLAEDIGFPEYRDVSRTDDSRFDKIKDDGLLPLLAHSDCDGYLTPDECAIVWPRLLEIVSKWPDEDRDKTQALKLIEGMKLAIKNKENLGFV